MPAAKKPKKSVAPPGVPATPKEAALKDLNQARGGWKKAVNNASTGYGEVTAGGEALNAARQKLQAVEPKVRGQLQGMQTQRVQASADRLKDQQAAALAKKNSPPAKSAKPTKRK